MEKEDLADDLLKGVEAIANYTGLTKRAVYGLAEKGRSRFSSLIGGNGARGNRLCVA